jgi:hypothetical protein
VVLSVCVFLALLVDHQIGQRVAAFHIEFEPNRLLLRRKIVYGDQGIAPPVISLAHCMGVG